MGGLFFGPVCSGLEALLRKAILVLMIWDPTLMNRSLLRSLT